MSLRNYPRVIGTFTWSLGESVLDPVVFGQRGGKRDKISKDNPGLLSVLQPGTKTIFMPKNDLSWEKSKTYTIIKVSDKEWEI